MSNRVLVFCVLWLIGSAYPTLAKREGSCRDFEIEVAANGRDIVNDRLIRVLADGAKIFSEETGLAVVDHLDFDSLVRPVSKGPGNRGRLEVARFGGGSGLLGWMERDDLLCWDRPLKHKTIDRKVFIRVPPAFSGDPSPVAPAYPSPTGSSCIGECRSVTRFSFFYVFGDDDIAHRVLISDSVKLGQHSRLMGWVDYESTIGWNTAIGIRPSESEALVRLFRNREGLTSASQPPIDVVGGKQWFRFAERIPVLDAEGGMYKVAAPGIGVLAPLENLKLKKSLENLEKLKNVDAFFLLDGTQSMGGSIEAVRRTVQSIAKYFDGDPALAEYHVRFGFRVYRDSYAHTSSDPNDEGVGEGLGFSSDCSDSKANGLQDFELAFRNYRTTLDDRDDFPERLFNGLRRAASDMAPCRENLKLLFVIGDAGDPGISPDSVTLQALKNSSKGGVQPFFIQTGRRPPPGAAVAYNKAYDDFARQTREITAKLLPSEFRGRSTRLDQRTMTLDESEQISTTIKKVIEAYSPAEKVADLGLSLLSGESLESYVSANIGKGDLPVLYWKLLQERLCPTLGGQCEERVDHRVVDGFARQGVSWEEEIFINDTEMKKWIDILAPFSGEVTKAYTTTAEKRKGVIENLQKSLQNHLNLNPLPDQELTIGEYIERGGSLPVNAKGALMQYNVDEIGVMNECDLYRLVDWLELSYRLLQSIQRAPDLMPVLKPVEVRGECKDQLSEKGKKIPALYMSGNIPLEPIGEVPLESEGEFSMKQRYGGASRYWIPRRFLP